MYYTIWPLLLLSPPFGITSGPEYFQKQMARILDGQEGVANMIDDVLVFGWDK